MLQRNSVNRVFFAKEWLQSGWGIYKQAPITWIFMILIFSIAYLIAISSLPGRAIAALLAPVFLGGIYVAAFKADNGEPIAMEILFSMFKDKQKLKQLLTIGGIGVAVVGLTYLLQNTSGSEPAMQSQPNANVNVEATTLNSTLSMLMFWTWSLATIFSVPLVAIANQGATESLKSSIFAALTNLIPLIIFFVCALLLTIVSIIPFGIGLLVVVPTLFCAMYFMFKTVYLDANDNVAAPLLSTIRDASSTDADADAEVANAIAEAKSEALKELGINPSNKFEEFLANQFQIDLPKDIDMRLPKGFSITYFDDYMQITRKWLGFQTFGALVGTAVVVFLCIDKGFLDIIVSDREIYFKIFCLLFIAMGLFSAYFTLASALNKTQIYVNKNAIAIQHHPIPWPGNKTIDAKEIQQIYVKTIETRKDNVTRYHYKVFALTLENQKIKLMSNLQKRQPALFIEKKIEDYIGIEDKVVDDE